MTFSPARGEIYSARLDPAEGSEMKKTRPVVIVSGNVDNRYSTMVLAVPITTHRGGQVYPAEVLLEPPEGGLQQPSRVLCYQVRALDKQRLCDHHGRLLRRWGILAPDTMDEVDQGLLIALGMD